MSHLHLVGKQQSVNIRLNTGVPVTGIAATSNRPYPVDGFESPCLPDRTQVHGKCLSSSACGGATNLCKTLHQPDLVSATGEPDAHGSLPWCLECLYPRFPPSM